MALRLLRTDNDPILRKTSKEIKKITPKIKTLAQDMIETLDLSNGLGLAGPQVGVLRRIIIVNNVQPNPDNEEDEIIETIVAINPIISYQEGEIIKEEACLSFPGQFGKVARPQKIKVSYTDLNGDRIEREFEEMTARCFCHEIDHLDGIVYLDRVIEGTLNIEEDEE